MGYSGAGGNWFMKKTRSKKSCDTVPLKGLRSTMLATEKWSLHDMGNREMNASPYWQQRNERSTMLATEKWTLHDIGNREMNAPDVGNCVMMTVSMSGPVRIHCLLFKENGEAQFSLWKSRHKADPYGVMNFISELEIGFRIANSCMRWRGIFTVKGSHKMGDRRIFLKKTSAPLSLVKAVWMGLFSARSISLDSTFNFFNSIRRKDKF